MSDKDDNGDIPVEVSNPDIVYKDGNREIQIDLAAREWIIIGIVVIILSSACSWVIF